LQSFGSLWNGWLLHQNLNSRISEVIVMTVQKAKPATTKAATAKPGSAPSGKSKSVKTTAAAAKKPALKKTAAEVSAVSPAKPKAAKPAPAKKVAAAALESKAPAAKIPVTTALGSKAGPAAASKPAAKPTPEERYRMVETAAYFIAEQHGFQGRSDEHWAAAEREIAAKLGQ
jgi:hypothetical protein